MAINEERVERNVLLRALDAALSIQHEAVLNHIERLRSRRPNATPAEIIDSLEKQYLAAVTGTGAAVGASAAAPGVGTGVALAMSAGETVTFLEASALFALAAASAYGEQIEDVERRRTLLFTILLGNSGTTFVQKAAGRTGKHWGRLLTNSIPQSKITAANKVLGRWFITKYGTKQGILVVGRAAPFGIGAAIGAAGNAALGRTVVVGARRAFGTPPASFASSDS